jgi:predicted acyl esterase
MRHRDALSRPQPLERGSVVEATIDMGVTSKVFGPGHRIRLEVPGSNFPRYDRNPNTGGAIASTTETQVAPESDLSRTDRPGRLTLLVITRPSEHA